MKYHAAIERGNCLQDDELTSVTPCLIIFRDPVAPNFCFDLAP